MPTYPDARGFDHPAAERATLRWWAEHGVFEQSLVLREGAEPFVFYEGPPTANGKPGIHHVMARTIKDLFCRSSPSLRLNSTVAKSRSSPGRSVPRRQCSGRRKVQH